MLDERPNTAASTEDFEFTALQEARNYRRALLDDFSPWLKGRVIEVGAGIGQITGGLRGIPAITELLCVEPDAGFCRTFARLNPAQQLIEGTLDKVSAEPAWDAILSINVLEHIRDDSHELRACRERLRPGHGCLCLFVPARPEIYAPIDLDFGHHRRYTRPELQAKLEVAGFDIVSLRYFNCVGYFAWWFNFRLLGKRHFDVASVRAFDRVVFPWVHQLETRLVPPPFGQSLMAVARARA